LTQDDPWRAIRAPFQLPADWHPAEGTCSRCHQPAISNDGVWWHDGASCQLYDARFIPEPPA
jgi:hypothetical protein